MIFFLPPPPLSPWKIVPPDSSSSCRPGRPGQVGEIRGLCPHGMMLGYLVPRGEEEVRYVDPDGFGRTGDLGRYDNEGNLFYVDRMKTLIK